MGLKEVGAPLTRPRHTWETGRGGERERQWLKKAEGGRGGQLCEGVLGRGCLG